MRWTTGDKSALSSSAAYPRFLGTAFLQVYLYLEQIVRRPEKDFLRGLAALVLEQLPPKGQEPYTAPQS